MSRMFNSRQRAPYPSKRQQLRRAPYRAFNGLLTVTLVLLSAVLLLLSRSDNQLLAQWRVRLLDLSTPALDAVFVPAGYVQRSLERLAGFYSNEGELARLRTENERLKGIEWGVEELQQKNDQLKALLNSVEEPGDKFITGRIVSANPSPFGNSAVVNVGTRNGVADGFAVVNAEGFIGRTSETGSDSSRILLLSDRLSRIPVAIGKTAAKAVMTGDGSGEPLVAFLPPDAEVREGDLVFTSGDGGDLPGGLQVGLLRRVNGDWRITPRARLQGLEFVSVIIGAQPALASQR